jgi:hypothetical protein
MQDWNELEPLDPGSGEAGSGDLGSGAAADPGAPVDPMAGGRGGPRPWRLTRTAIISGVAAVILVVAGISIAVAQTSASSTTPSTTVPSAGPNIGKHGGGFRGRGGFGPFGGPGKFGMGGMRGIIHGEFVRPNGSNGYQTVDVQTGQVTSVSSSSITLKSADGFTKTYSVTTNTLVDAGRDGIGSVKKGDNATVDAVVTGSTSEARNINDLTNLAALRQHWAPQPPAPNTPSSTGTSST